MLGGESPCNAGMRCGWRLCPLPTSVLLTALVLRTAMGASLPEEAESALLKADWAGVLTTLEKADIKDPDAVCRIVAAHACLATNRGGAAAEAFASLDPDALQEWFAWTETQAAANEKNPVALYLLADSLARLGKWGDALSTLDRSIAADGKFAPAYATRGLVRMLQGGAPTDEAMEDVLRATALDTKSAYAKACLGFYWILQKVPPEAAKAYREALALDQTFGEARLGLACALFASGDFDEAFSELESAASASPALAELCLQNRAGLLAGVNRFLHEIEKYVEGPKPGTTIETRFKVGEIPVDGKVIAVYEIRPSGDYSQTSTSLGHVAQDAAQRLGKPLKDISVLVQAHGWGSNAAENRLFAARMAAAGGFDAAIVLDIPEYRGHVSPEASGIEQFRGKAVAALKWGEVSNLAAVKVANTGRAVYEQFGHPASFFGDSGSTEAFVKQGRLSPEQVPAWDQAILAAYPFHDVFKSKNVQVPDMLADKCGRIVNLVTAPGHWSNYLDGKTDKVQTS